MGKKWKVFSVQVSGEDLGYGERSDVWKKWKVFRVQVSGEDLG
jgi:hypothetical protein